MKTPVSMTAQLKLFALSFMLYATCSAFAESGVGVYTLWNKGSVRSNALAGATVSQTKNSAAVVENPAAMAFQQSRFSGTFDYATPEDKNLKIKNTTQQNENYFFIGGSFLFYNRLGLGVAGEQLSFFAENQPDEHQLFRFENSVEDYHLASAIRLGDSVSLSASKVYSFASRTITFKNSENSFKANNKLTGSSEKYGLLIKATDRLSFGATYKTAGSLKVTGDEGTGSGIYDFAYQPEVSQVGFHWSSHSKTLKNKGLFPLGVDILAQLDVVRFPGLQTEETLFYGPIAVFTSENEGQLDTNRKYIPRLSTELTIFRSSPVTVLGRGGTYLEPAYLKGNKMRPHYTAGALVRAWFVVFQVATDVAKNYRNRNYGLGFEFES